ncbi:MAG: TerB N-terminal domain-containing protein [Rikenellaceae bacterium]
MSLLLLLAMLVQWLISILGYIIAAAVIYWIAYWLITSVKESTAKGVDSPPIPHKTKQPNIIITSQQEIHKVVEEKGLNIPIEQTKANITTSLQANNVSNETADIKIMNTLDFIDNNDYLEDYEFDGVPYWRHTYIYSAEPIRSANKYQQAFYRHLKAEFYKGRYIDVEDCSNYVFILMFDLVDDYKQHKDYALVLDQLDQLGSAYPITDRYLNDTLAKGVAEVLDSNRSQISIEQPEKCCWIKRGEIYDLEGVKLLRGNFYIGEQFVYREDGVYGRATYRKITSAVLTPNSNFDSKGITVMLFKSYAEMTSEYQCLYIKWLSNEVSTNELPIELIYLYIYGLEFRMFADEEATDQDRIEILIDALEMLEQITDFSALGYLCNFIDYSLIKMHPNIPGEIISNCSLYEYSNYNKFIENKLLQEIEDDVVYGIDAYAIATITKGEILNNIPEQYKDAVKTHFIKLFNKNNKKGVTVYSNNYEYEHRFPMMCNRQRIFGNFYPQQADIKSAKYKEKHINSLSFEIAIDNVVRSISNGFNLYNTLPSKMLALLSLPIYLDIVNEKEFKEFRNRIESITNDEDVTVVEFDDILEIVGYKRGDEKSLHKGYFSIFDRAFQRIGYGITPNYEIDDKKLNFGIKCAIYRRYTDQTLKRGVAHERTNIFVRLAAMMFRGVEVTEQDSEYVRKYINANCKVAVNREHLYAYFVWLSAGKLGIDAKIKKGIAELLNSEQSSKLCNSLIELCCLGGNPAPKKISALQRILPLFGEDGSDIHSRIHRFYTGEGDNFVTVEKQSGADGFKIPKPNEAKQTFHIDQKKINKLEVQTKESHKILSAIFNNNESESEVSVEQVDTSAKVDPIMELLKLLLTKECWQRSEVESLCRERGLMLGSVLEKINDYSFSKIDEAVVDDDGDEIYVAVENKERLLNM